MFPAGAAGPRGTSPCGRARKRAAGLPSAASSVKVSYVARHNAAGAPRSGGISSVGLEHLLCTQGVNGSSPLFSTQGEVIDMMHTQAKT